MIHILVVDDDKNLNQTVCTYLNDCGFEAKGVLSANEAYDEMYNHLYELIISDIMMPEIDGFEFAETVRQVNKQIPILVMPSASISRFPTISLRSISILLLRSSAFTRISSSANSTGFTI